jgi:3-dehydroquinate synthetase
VAKYALISLVSGGDDAMTRVVDEDADRILARDPEVHTDLVARCVELKADVVARDPEEQTGLRSTLNYGHTFAHALEAYAGYDDVLHGEAVAVGLVAAGALAAATGRIDAAAGERHREIVSALELPVTVRGDLDRSKLIELMRRDKKAKGGLTFVLPGPSGLERVDDPPPAALARAFEAVGVEG